MINGVKGQGRIKLKIKYIPKDELDERAHEIQNSYFPARKGCQMVLYQDAHTPAQLPQFNGLLHSNGSKYKPSCAWKDIHDAISDAKKFIYIAGWSVNSETRLLRGDDDPEGKSNIGELLKAKAEDGVCVHLLLWNEPGTAMGMKTMNTNDVETKAYFSNTEVKCILASRQNEAKFEASTSIYTHHQKIVVCDVSIDEKKRSFDETRRSTVRKKIKDLKGKLKRKSKKNNVVAFLGGLDITQGRYDTPEFHLFKTIKNDHQNDFLNKNFSVSKNVGPRQPWVRFNQR